MLCWHKNSDPELRFPPYHSGAGEGLVSRIRSEVISKTDDREMLLALKQLYTSDPFNELNMWRITRDVLSAELDRAIGMPGVPPGSIVPD